MSHDTTTVPTSFGESSEECMSRLFVSGVVLTAFVAVTTPTPASAVTFDKLAYVTFSAPVQLPGATLGAGTYRFHLTNSETSRNVLQVLNNDGTIVYAMFNTRPDSRMTVTPDPTLTFIETPAGVPPALRSLFYGFEYFGYEFVYPKGEPNMTPPAAWQPEITYTVAPLAPVAEPVFEAEVAALPSLTFDRDGEPKAHPLITQLRQGRQALRTSLQEFGLTPASRTRVTRPVTPAVDPLAKYRRR